MAQQQLKIHQLIVHKIHHKTSDKAILYDLESPLDDVLEGILRKQISENRQHKHLCRAIFNEPEDGKEAFFIVCNKLLADPNDFIKWSQEIATRLFVASPGNSHEGDLLVCTFSENEEVDLRWLALLKMVPQSALIGEEETQGRKRRIVLKPVSEILPTGFLQKCAFILPQSQRKVKGKKPADLYVLDLQQSKYSMSGTRVASFFSNDFLQCQLNLTSVDSTVLFPRLSLDWASKKTDWPPDRVIHFETETFAALRDEQIDIPELSQRLIPNIEEQEDYLNYLQKRGFDTLVFKPDPAKRAELLRYTFFEGDHGLFIRVLTENLKSMFQIDKPAGKPYEIRITTSTWNQKYGRRR